MSKQFSQDKWNLTQVSLILKPAVYAEVILRDISRENQTGEGSVRCIVSVAGAEDLSEGLGAP